MNKTNQLNNSKWLHLFIGAGGGGINVLKGEKEEIAAISIFFFFFGEI